MYYVAMTDQLVLQALDHHGVLKLTLNRPERNNGWTLEMEEAYFDALAAAAADTAVRAVVVTGAGKSFCPGLDMQALAAASEGQRFGIRPRRPMTFALLIPKPVIAAINGACAGIGFIQAACADLRFAARGAKLTTAFARRGLPAENSIAWLLQRLIGHANAADLLLSARTIDADEARVLGFVHRVVERDELMPAALAYARDLAENVSPISMATIKAQLWGDWDRTQDESRRRALAYVAELSDHHSDVKEGVRSFVEKRKPDFPGLGVEVEVDKETAR
jgi:enoyl-CoA hydratase/carnithine racemase